MPLNDIVNVYDHNSSDEQHHSSLYDEHKIFNDPIHGHITLDKYMVDIIDTPQFQRLRDLKQLGTLYFVFPGASHNRFEHSIGVGHLSNTLIKRFAREQPELKISDREIKCVSLAGLCHDLGHGPLSHVFDTSFLPVARPELNWSHEQGSEMMVDYLIDENNIDIDSEDVNFIKALFMGEPRSNSQKEEFKFMFDIVANKKNSVDVDKFDYIERDAYNLGLRNSYDAKRLLIYSRVINNEICYHYKEAYNIYEMFHTRYTLYRQIYNHRVSVSIELMVVDTLLAADAYLKISDSVRSAEEYANLSDDLLRTIERSKCTELEESRSIIRCIRTRKLYKFVDEFLIHPELEPFINKALSNLLCLKQETFKIQDIIGHQTNNDHLDERDVIANFSKINYSMNDQNPVDSIRFFSKHNIHEPFHIPKEQVSYMIPSTFQDVTLRIFTRTPSKTDAIRSAFHKYILQFKKIDKIPDTSIHHPLYH
ncbi:hypothetical protein BDB01DRAFT_712761 [Pilobolus umbonatus]|nr:hypothetical protein BDB01DRAFT_712761 [Pilobolus umbonatus]